MRGGWMCGSWLLVRAEYVPDGLEPYEYPQWEGLREEREYHVVSGRMSAPVRSLQCGKHNGSIGQIDRGPSPGRRTSGGPGPGGGGVGGAGGAAGAGRAAG
eukprot:5188575-Prymnesium_polylepis.1